MLLLDLMMRTLAALLLLCAGRSQGGCPHNMPGLKRWSQSASWPSHAKPARGAKVQISSPILLDEVVPELFSLTIDSGGILVLSPQVHHQLRLRFILVKGEMHIGSQDCRFSGTVNITLIGNHGDIPAHPDFGEKYIGVAPGATLELHGEDKLSWTKLTATVRKLADQPGLHYEHKTSVDRSTLGWQRGMFVFVFDPASGALLRREVFETAAPGDWTREHDTPKLLNFLNEVKSGEVVALVVQNTFKSPDTGDLSQVYDAAETLAYGHVTGNSAIRDIDDKDAYVLITQKGNPSTTVEAVDFKTGKPIQYAETSLTLWPKHLKVTAMSFVDNDRSYLNYVNVRSMNTNAGYPKLRVLDDVSTWKPGDRVVLASTDYDWQQAEEATVVACLDCDSNVLQLDFEPQFVHWGEVTNGVDMRGEVGLLTRNILIQGEMADHCPPANGNCHRFHYDTFGGHLKVVHGFKNVHIEGVEAYHMGQQTRKGRYPLHFHMLLDVDEIGGYSSPAYARSNSVHHCFSRCITVHGTQGLTVKDNVGYDTLGHCFFTEDGGEKRNTFDGNLGFSTKKGSVLPSDEEPATFWFTNPLLNVTNNVAAGGENSVGFWYVFPDEPEGPSKGLGFLQKDEARHTAYALFSNNVAHSNVKAGLFADFKIFPDETMGDINHYEPHQVPLNLSSPLVPTTLHRLTAYKNSYQNVWLRGGWFIVDHASLSDSLEGITMASGGNGNQFLRNSVIVGESNNEGEPSGIYSQSQKRWNYMPRSVPLPYAIKSPIQGFIFYDGPVFAENVFFTGFKSNENRTASALGFHRKNYYSSSPVSAVANVRFGFNDGVPTGNRMYDGNSSVYGFTDYDGDIMATFRDSDGSATGVHGGSQVVEALPYFMTSRCYVRSNWNVAICPHKFGALELYTRHHDEQAASGGVVMVRDDIPDHPISNPWKNARDVLTLLGGSHSYTLHWAHKTPTDVELRLHGVEKGQWVRVGVCLPRDAVFELYTYSPVYKGSRDQFVSLSSVQELDADTTGYAYYWDQHTGLLFYKFQNFYPREGFDADECSRSCAYLHISIKGGNLNDHDCRHRAYGPYKRAPINGGHALHNIALPATDSAPPKGWGAGRTRPFNNQPSVNGHWGQWSTWSKCSVPCGGGVETRVRACNKPKPQGAGSRCSGPRAEVRPCNVAVCGDHNPIGR